MNKSTSIGQTSDGYHTFDELYEHRNILFMKLCEWIDEAQGWGHTWKSKLHADGTMFAGWFIAGIGTEVGKQITYHLPLPLWDMLHVRERERAPAWDGHTSQDVVQRLKELW